eukprot:scaffold1663_cov171-Amphora_coffeaeformis.AAC.6
MWIKFLKRLLFYPLCAILATATLTYLYSYPHAPVTWLLVAAGWSIHTQFYHVAVQDWLNSTTLRQSEDAVRSRALVYAYMGDCSSAMDVYEHELGPLRQTLHFNGEFVEYQPNEVADLVAIYNDCAGETERTFALTEEAQKRLMDTIRLYNDLMMMNNKSNDNNTVYMDLWQAKKVAEQQMPPEPGSQTFANPLPHANPAYAYEIFVRTPVEARYAAGQIDDYQAYQKMVSERHDIWTELNLSKNITWQVETLSGQRPAAAASIDDSEF